MSLRPSSQSEVAEMVRDAHDRSVTLRIVGHGSWLGAGAEVPASATRLELAELRGIAEYVAGDLTLTAGAGTSLGELDEATASHGQWCPVLPWGDDSASLGAVFATATAGPFEGALGRPRDLAIGLSFVDGTGATVRAGGRVVKNVAGFDLTRLLVGSWGTLGAITEISVRLRARPGVDETWAVAFDAGDAASLARRDAFERGPLAPLALRHLTDAEALSLDLPAGHTLLARIGGNKSFVAASRIALRALGNMDACDAATWKRFRAIHDEGPAHTACSISDPLSLRVKRQFDPKHILNPGIMGELLR